MEVLRRFGVGIPVGEPVAVGGGLSNKVWRVATDQGVFAVKRMVASADRPGFVANVEASFAVERQAYAAGVRMPEPIVDPGTGRALARIDGSLYRVHRWVDARPGRGTPEQAAHLLAEIHAAGCPHWSQPPGAEPHGAESHGGRLPGVEPHGVEVSGAESRGGELSGAWDGARWGSGIARLARAVSGVPEQVLVVDSHGDLDPKNTLLRASDGQLVALDWDAAGPVGAAGEAIALALDWCGGDPGVFAAVVRTYVDASSNDIPAQPWIFGCWVAAQGGWLDYNAGRNDAEAASARAKLEMLGRDLDAWLAAIP